MMCSIVHKERKICCIWNRLKQYGCILGFFMEGLLDFLNWPI